MTAPALQRLIPTLKARTLAWWLAVENAMPGGRGRRSLWVALIALVMAVLVTLVWLAGRYEASQLQAELERDTANAVSDLRTRLSRHVQALQAAPPNFSHRNHSMDFIFIRELRLEAWVGIYGHEKIAPQLIEFDLEMALPGDAVFRTHKFADTIDYASVVARIGEILKAERFGLVETLGRTFLPMLIREFADREVAQAAGPALASMLIYLLMAAILAWKPQGLFPAHKGK